MFQSKCMDDGAEVGTLCADNYDPTFATVVLCNTEMQAQMGNDLLSSQHLIARTRLPQIIRPLVKKTFQNGQNKVWPAVPCTVGVSGIEGGRLFHSECFPPLFFGFW